ncbi:MAG: hypothetical protein AAB628_00765 [Patescibacteria group bacterium]
MNSFLKKTILAVLTGIVFLVGGISTAEAAEGGYAFIVVENGERVYGQLYPDLKGCLDAKKKVNSSGGCDYFPSLASYLQSIRSATVATTLTPTGVVANTGTTANTPVTGGGTSGGGWSYPLPGIGFNLSSAFPTKEACDADRDSKNDTRLGACEYRTASQRSIDTDTVNADPLGAELTCNFSWKGGFEFGGCFAWFLYSTVYKVAEIFLVFSLQVFDFSLMLSISPQYVNQPFITSAWEIVRDFSNMVFIFVLLYTGILTMLGTGGARKTIVNVIIVALLINFSLFFTKVVIDAGNVLAVGVYESMGPPAQAGQPRELSKVIASSFSPQQYAFIGGSRTLDNTDRLTIYIIASVVAVIAGWIFLTIALLFIGRLLAFWFLMIISPFAFISMILPGGGKFGDWFKALLHQTMMAPVFLFMLYLIMQFINAGGGMFSSSGSPALLSSQFIYQVLLIPVLQATMIIMALFYARDIAKSLSGKFGEIGATVVGKSLGFAGGLAGGAVLKGAAFAGKNVVGRIAHNKLQDTGFKSWAAESKWGRMAFSATEKAASGNYDVRNTKLGKYATGKASGLGVDFGQGTDSNYQKGFEDTKKADLAFAKKVMYDEDGKIIPGAKDKMKKQLEEGYAARTLNGGNVAAKAAAKTLERDQVKLDKLLAKKTDLEKKLATLVSGVDYDKAFNKAQVMLKSADIQLAQAIESKNQANITLAEDIASDALFTKNVAEKMLATSKTGQDDLDKINKEIKESVG